MNCFFVPLALDCGAVPVKVPLYRACVHLLVDLTVTCSKLFRGWLSVMRHSAQGVLSGLASDSPGGGILW